MFEKISYSNLNSRQIENYNFQKISAVLADYGYNYLRLTDDWHGADFIACHICGNIFLKVQLKGRLTLDKKYQCKNVHIAFCDLGTWYIYPHDTFLEAALNLNKISKSVSWDDKGSYDWPSVPRWAMPILEEYKI